MRVEIPTRHGVLLALDDVSFTIAPGEVLGFVGESGAGKSLTGMAILGLLEPPGHVAAGEVWLGDRRIDALPPREMRRVRGKDIGAVFQDPLMSLNPLLTIGEQLDETITTHLPVGRARGEGALARAAARGGHSVAGSARHASYPHQLSGGMRQRVVIALALCAEPRLVVADEPTTALDVSIQAQVLALLRKLCGEKGTAMLLVTHDMGVIAETADRVAVMYAGRIVEIGSVEDVIRAPVHPYTRGLMGAIPTLGPDRRAARADRGRDAASQRAAAGLRLPSALSRRRRALPRARCRISQPHGTRRVACWRARRVMPAPRSASAASRSKCATSRAISRSARGSFAAPWAATDARSRRSTA